MSKTLQNSKVINHKTIDLVETIDWVGMDAVNLPIQYKYQGHLYRTAAKLEIAVSLDNPEFKGIDMAELYFQSKELVSNQELNFINLKDLSERLLETHADRTNNARIEISFDAFKEKDTLRSDEKGLHAYPISLELVNASGDFDTIINFEILYASTCPCSEAASRQENLEKFEEFFAASKNPKKDFKDWYLDSQNSFAHPHAQKSKAAFSLVMAEYIENPVDFALETIHELEDLIQTSVHAAVRQEDEAAFTTKMGDNLIFIEDAAKKFKAYIKSKDIIASSSVELTHYESLHPHNAKAFFTT